MAAGQRFERAGSALDWGLLGIISLLLHVLVWLSLQAEPHASPTVAPRVVELSLVSPAPRPPAVVPSPPTAQPEPPPPPPKPRPRPAPAPRPRPVPTPAPPAPPVVSPPTAARAPAPVAPVTAPLPSPAPPVFVPATRAASTRNPKPEYPMIAKRRGWQGTVLLEVEVKENGTPGSLKVLESSGRGILDESALRAVRLWRFNPATEDGRPVVSRMTLSIVFKLER